MTELEWHILEELLKAGRVESVLESGLMVLRFPDGSCSMVTIPQESIRFFRTLAALQEEEGFPMLRS